MKFITKKLATLLCAMSVMAADVPVAPQARPAISDRCLNAINTAKNSPEGKNMLKCVELGKTKKKDSFCVSACSGFGIPKAIDEVCTTAQEKQLLNSLKSAAQEVTNLRQQLCKKTTTTTKKVTTTKKTTTTTRKTTKKTTTTKKITTTKRTTTTKKTTKATTTRKSTKKTIFNF